MRDDGRIRKYLMMKGIGIYLKCLNIEKKVKLFFWFILRNVNFGY